ncbi:hypothetical protein CIK96_09500 [Prevotella sp. P4-98]|nr:hypothetical protein CIK96_09500 [Prevotella sp. P4-98]
MIDRKEKNVGGRASEWLFRTVLPRCRLTTRDSLVGWFMDVVRNKKGDLERPPELFWLLQFA